MLLLDEPTNHLDAESVSWLERHLREYEGTVLMVTHDRYFLDNVTGWILELDRGRVDSLKATTLPGWNRNGNVLLKRSAKNRRVNGPQPMNLTGLGSRHGLVKPSLGPESQPTKSCLKNLAM